MVIWSSLFNILQLWMGTGYFRLLTGHPCFSFYNSGWVLFIPNSHMSTAVYFFTTPDGCCLFLIVIRTSMFVFFYNSGWVLFAPNCHVAIAVHFFSTPDGCCLFPDCDLGIAGFFFFKTLDGYCFFPIPHLQHKCGMAWTPSSQAIHIVQGGGYVNCKCVTMYCAWAPLPSCKR